MGRKRRDHIPGFKAKVALAAIRSDKTLAELSEHYNVHQNQIHDWKKQLLEQADSVFGSSQERNNTDAAHLKELHAQIGELTLEDDFLAKALGR